MKIFFVMNDKILKSLQGGNSDFFYVLFLNKFLKSSIFLCTLKLKFKKNCEVF